MAPKDSKSASAPGHPEFHGYEFLGPPGAFLISSVLPVVCYSTVFLCNDISGCPAPSLLSPSTLTLAKLKQEIGWPAEGIWGLGSWEVTAKVLGWYVWSLILFKVLPGQELEGLPLAQSGGKLKYKFNTWGTSMVTLTVLAAGTIAQGADFPVWTFIYDNYVQVLTANIIVAFTLAVFVYVRSFGVTPGNKEFRELAAGGCSGNMLYDWFIGRELNPRISLPLFGEIDIKTFCEIRPGLLGWLVLNLSNVAHQYKTFGYVTDSILLVTFFQGLYILDSFWMEPSILSQIDITTDGFGFMLSFGDLVWVPFIYSIQTRYLSFYPLSLGPWGIAGVLAVLATGFFIFRASNNQKHAFRTNPNGPSVSHLKYIETKSGSRLLISGWWGMSRHMNYCGDWIQGWAYVLPTGFAGYLVQKSSIAPTPGQSLADGSFVYTSDGVHTELVPGAARGWGTIFTYFYMLYFAILLVHRERRDDAKCAKKYGDDWKKYKQIVRYRIIPGIY